MAASYISPYWLLIKLLLQKINNNAEANGHTQASIILNPENWTDVLLAIFTFSTLTDDIREEKFTADVACLPILFSAIFIIGASGYYP